MRQLLNKLHDTIFKSDVFIFSFIFILAVIVVIHVRLPHFIDRYALNEDTRWITSWVYRFYENKNFESDLLSNYTYWLAPAGIKILYITSSKFLDPILVAKAIPVFMFFLSAVFIFKLGYHLEGKISAFFAGLIFVLFAWGGNSAELEIFGPGNGGDFCFPLSVLFLYALIKKKYLLLPEILLLQALFYPILILVSILALTFDFIVDKDSLKTIILKNKTKFLHFLICLVVVLLLPLNYIYNNKFGDTYTKKEMLSMKEFYAGGKLEAFFPSVKEQICSDQTGICFDRSMFFLLLLSLTLTLFLKKDALRMPAAIWYFIASSFILFFLAHIILLKIYMPAKYVGIPLNLFLVLFISTNIDRLIRRLNKFYVRYVVFGLFFVLIISSYIFVIGIKRQHGQISAQEKSLLAFLATLPPDSLLAGHPELMDNVHTFSKRRVLITKKLSMPFHRRYYDEIKKRTYDFFAAYYSGTEQGIKNFCQEYNITHLVVDKKHFSGEYINKANFYFLPFNSFIAKLTKKKDFFLDSIPESKKIFMKDNIFVIKCQQ